MKTEEHMTQNLPRALSKPRDLHFPTSRSLGWLDTQKWQGQAETSWRENTRGDSLDSGSGWQRLAEACGKVTVPAGTEVQLRVTTNAASDLSPLARLAADDLQSLILAFKFSVTDKQLHHLQGLSGLHTLNLWMTGVTGEGLSQLQSLQGLLHLAYGLVGMQPDTRYLEDADLVHLKGLPNLGTLWLDARHITGGGFVHLQHLPKLHNLRLINVRAVDTVGWELLSELTTLQSLDMAGVSLGDADLLYIGKLDSLQALDLSDTELDGTGFSSLRGLTQLHALHLHRAGRKMRESELAHLCQFPCLEEVNYAENRIGEEGLKHLASIPSLRRLDLYGGTGAIADLTCKGLEYLCQARQLEILNLSEASIDENGLVCVGQLPNLRELYLSSLEITDVGIAHLAESTNLRTLSLGSTQVTDAGLYHLQEMGELDELDLAYTGVSGSGLCHLKGLTQMHKLSLGGQGEFQEGCLADLCEMKGLEEVALFGPGFSDVALGYLQNFTNLRRLNLWSSRVSDAGLGELAQFIGLESLNLAQTQIGDEGLAHLAQLVNLRELDLSETCISDAGLDVLGHLVGLERLYLRGTQISKDRLSVLKEALPNCEIVG